MDIKKTLKSRGKDHGDFSENAYISSMLKKVVRSQKKYSRLTPEMTEALDMIFHKIGRIVAGDPTVKDHWHDVAGYATLVEEGI